MFRILIHGNYFPTGPFHYPSNHSSPPLMAAVFEYLTSISFSKSCPFSKPITLLCCYSWWPLLLFMMNISLALNKDFDFHFCTFIRNSRWCFFIRYFCTVTVFYSHEVNHGDPSFSHPHTYIYVIHLHFPCRLLTCSQKDLRSLWSLAVSLLKQYLHFEYCVRIIGVAEGWGRVNWKFWVLWLKYFASQAG